MLQLLLVLFIQQALSQNIPLTCSIISPNNLPTTPACFNGTTTFFNAEFPEETFNEECLCCTPGIDDNPPDNCFFDQTLTEFEGKVICSENFDCCACGAIICDPCLSIECNGDQGCLGVDPITIQGNTLAGASLVCNGDISCFRTVVTGDFVTLIDCGGDFACGNSSFTLNQNGFNDISLTLGFFGDNAGTSAVVVADNVGLLACVGDDSCPFSNMDLTCDTPIGCPLTVNGDRAAINSFWDIDNAASLNTNGDDSVKMTTFFIDFITSGGGLDVTGGNAAEGSTWTVTFADALRCVGDNACSKTTFDISFVPDNINPNLVEVAGPFGAFMSTWTLVNPADISCGNIGACQMMSLNANCVGVTANNNGCSFSCGGIDACQNGTYTVTNVNNFNCDGTNACSDSTYDIDCIGVGCPVTCMSGCKDSTFDIANPIGLSCTQQIPIFDPVIPGLIIGFEGTCENSVFTLDNNQGGSLTCNGFRACQCASITASLLGIIPNLNDKGIECQGEDACLDAVISGECAVMADPTKGCPLICEGARACGVDTKPTREITLERVSFVSCTSGNIGNTAFPACGDGRRINLAPINTDFMISCSGPEACRNGYFKIDDKLVTPGALSILDVKCDGTNACAGTTFDFDPTRLEINGKFGCSANNACNGLTLIIRLTSLSDTVFISLLECSATNSCDNALIDITVPDGLGGDRSLTLAELNTKIGNGDIEINIKCGAPGFCNGATINGVITFNSQSQFNVLFPNAENPKLINSLGTLWVSIIGVLIVVIIILVRKNYQYRKLEQNMATSIHIKSNKQDKRRAVKQNSTGTAEIQYSDKTSDVI